MLALSEKQMLIQALGKCVFDEVQTAVAPFILRLANVEKMIGDMPVPKDGIDGKNGENGKDADYTAVQEMIDKESIGLRSFFEKTIATLPTPLNGKDGIDGKDGKDGIDGRDADMIAIKNIIQETFASLPKPEKGEKGDKGDPGEPGKDGKDGRDGIDGKSVTLDDIRDCLADLVRKAFADVPVPRNCVGGFINRGGHLFLSFSDGSNSDLGPVVGKDGADCDIDLVRAQVAAFLATIEKPKDGKDGKDGVGFDDLQLEFNGERLVEVKFIKGETAKVFNWSFPVPIDRGIWKAGQYERADMVQRDGSMWIAEKDTDGQPGLPNSGWRLCTKRGQNGKDGKQGPEGPQGKPGRDGRDLTQMGLDGSKW